MYIILEIRYGLIQVSKDPNIFSFLITENIVLHSPYNALLGWWGFVA